MVQAGKARKFSDGNRSASNLRSQEALYGIGRNNDNQIGGQQFSGSSGFVPITQGGLKDSTKVNVNGSQFSGAIGFVPRLCDLDIATKILDITKTTGTTDLFETPPGDVLLTLSSGTTSDLEFIEFPRFDGHRVCIQINALQSITVKHTAGATDYAIKTPSGADVLFSGAEQLLEFSFSTTLSQWLLVSGMTGGAGATCPTICDENDLGTVNGLVEVDWSLGPFHRMILDGDTSVGFSNLPTAPGWHEITVEFLQDNTGGHTVTFVDIFRNNPEVIVREGTNQYTITKFYSYFDGFDNILQWQPPFLTLQQSASLMATQGIIHAILSVDQTLNLAIGNHIEFDTALFASSLTVSGGVGQAKGIFSGFIPGRTYQCDVFISGEGSGNTLNWSAQWFDIASAIFIGNKAEQRAETGAVDRDSQHVGTAFFQPFALSDTLEVRITNNTVLTSILAGNLIADPTTFAVIKDCGQTPEQVTAGGSTGLQDLIDEDLAQEDIPLAPPAIGFSAKSVQYNQYQNRNLYSNVLGTSPPLNLPIVDAQLLVPFTKASEQIYTVGIPKNDPLASDGQPMCHSFGFVKVLKMEVSLNTLDKNLDISLARDEIPLGTFFTINAGVTGTFTSTGNTPLQVGHRYCWHWQTTDELNATGNITVAITTSIEWGFV